MEREFLESFEMAYITGACCFFFSRGGILGVPALVLGLGLSMTQAAPVSLLAVGAAAAVGAIDGLRHGLVRYRAALLIALLGALFSPLGVFVAHQMPEALLKGLFSALMVLVAWRMLQRLMLHARCSIRSGLRCIIVCCNGGRLVFSAVGALR